MKYLYPYECEKEKLSSPDELQSAIDGNRREGRRSSYGQYPEMVGATPPPSHLNRNQGSHHHTSPLSLVSRQLNGHNSQGMSSGEYFLTFPQQTSLLLVFNRDHQAGEQLKWPFLIS